MREALTAGRLSDKSAEHNQFQKVHALQSLCLSAERERHFEAGKYHNRQHQRRRGEIRGGFLGKVGTAFLLRPYRLYPLRSPGGRKELHDAAWNDKRQRSPRGRPGISKPGWPHVWTAGRKRPGAFRCPAVQEIPVIGGQDAKLYPHFLRCAACAIWHTGAAGAYGNGRNGAWHAGGQKDRPFRHYQRYRRHF